MESDRLGDQELGVGNIRGSSREVQKTGHEGGSQKAHSGKEGYLRVEET